MAFFVQQFFATYLHNLSVTRRQMANVSHDLTAKIKVSNQAKSCKRLLRAP
jgi:hypothetical protein